jgi:NAD(P)H dehydrogenase (quinone)
MNKILITGATGHLGNEVAKRLKDKIGANSIAVLVRNGNSEKAKHYHTDGFEVRVGDYDDYETLTKAFAGIETLYFVSGSDLNKRLQQHKNVVQAAKQAGVKHILYTSTVRKDESEKAPLHLVVNAHKQTELWIQESGLAYTILRHNLYSEVVSMFIGDKTQLQKSKVVYLPTGHGKTAFVAREDFAEAEAIILSEPEKHKNKIYEFNASATVSFYDIARFLSETLEEDIQYISPSVTDFEATLKSMGLPDAIISLITMFSLGIANGEFDKTENDLETILGRKTKTMAAYIKDVYQ